MQLAKRQLSKERTILSVIIFVYFITMYSFDNPVIFTAAYQRLEWLCQGKIMDFLFDWSPIVPYSVYSQFLFMLWVAPVKILGAIFRAPFENSMGAYLWYKLSMAICFWVAVRETQKIAETLNMDRERTDWVGLFMVSSLFSALPVFHLAQVDVVYMPFLMYGVRKYIEGDYKKFMIAFLIANPVKYLTIFVFLPLILLKEKKILYIFRDFIIGLALVPAEILIKNMTSILYRGGGISLEQIRKPYNLATSQIRALLVNTFAGPDGAKASVVVVVYGMLCILAYCCYAEGKKRAELTVWLAFSSLAVLFTFGTMHCHWIVLVAPFMILLLFMNKHSIRINFILEAFIPMAFMGVYAITQSEVFGGRATFDDLLFSFSGYLMNRRSSHSTNDMIHFIHNTFAYPGEFEFILPAVAVLGMVAFMIINLPYFQFHTDGETGVEEKSVWKSWYWFRVAVLVLWFFFNFYCLFK